MTIAKVNDSIVLVTGGTGSFGSTMVTHLLNRGASEVRVLSRDEAKQDEMRNRLRDSRVRFYIGDTRDAHSVATAVRGSNLIFHAAAMKQVPSAEFFPIESVKTNVHGSANVLQSAIDFGVEAVVCLSTDKAVYPINAMGMSKALMEKTAAAFARNNPGSPTRIAVTRYGNVMYSRGSVIPLFVRQIRERGIVSVTDPRMTRFLMSLDESVDLVEYAFENATSGDLFVRKAPACTVEVLATALFRLFGHGAPKFKEIGVRHGEKLYESLLSVEEKAHAEDLGEYFRVPLDTRSLDYEIFFDHGEQRPEVLDAYTSHNTDQLGVDQVVELLLTLPEIRRELDS